MQLAKKLSRKHNLKLKEIKSQLIQKASKLENPALEVRLCIEKVLSMPIEKQILNSDKEIESNKEKEIEALLNQRLAGMPMAYILGEKEFYGHVFKVNKNVLIPRPDTELIVEKTIEIARMMQDPKILDLCTGSGAIAASVSYDLKQDVYFSDISNDALDIAKFNYEKITNRQPYGRLGSLFECWEDFSFDIIATNPPYLTEKWYKETEYEVKQEPKLALVDYAEDGLDIIRTIIEHAPQHLNPNGYLLIEGDYRQMEKCAKILSLKGFKDVTVLKDLNDKDRVVYGRK